MCIRRDSAQPGEGAARTLPAALVVSLRGVRWFCPIEVQVGLTEPPALAEVEIGASQQ